MRGFDVRDAMLSKGQKRALAAARDAAELSGAARLGWGRSRQTAVEAGGLTEQQRRHRAELGLPEDELEEGEGGRPVGSGGPDGGDDGEDAAASASASSTAPGAARRRRRRGDGDGAKAGIAPEDTTSEFLGKAEVDFQGKSWVEPDAESRAATVAEAEDRPAYVPRKCIHRFTGHSKGVQDVEFFPDTGHLLLTASLDNTVRIWQSGGTRKCQRVYSGHTAGVRQARFRSDGRSFATCSFDTHVKLWDTETGKCTSSFQTAAKGTPFCVSFHPTDEESFIVGASDRRATQFDARSGEITQTYDYHLDAVNTVTFFDDGRKMVTTSDDKKILVWEYGINVPVRWIADPSMHSIAAATLHPSGTMWCAQSMDNQVLVYNLSPKLSLNRKQRFTGHINAGYACKLSLSANGQFIASGDAQGRLWVWDWKSRKPYAKLPAHEGGPCIGCAWNPGQGSYVATCGWDGVAKLWGPASGK
jgi:pre-mRNA-processing factor 17